MKIHCQVKRDEKKREYMILRWRPKTNNQLSQDAKEGLMSQVFENVVETMNGWRTWAIRKLKYFVNMYCTGSKKHCQMDLFLLQEGAPNHPVRSK